MAGTKNSGRKPRKVEQGQKFQKGSELGLNYLLTLLAQEGLTCPKCKEEINVCPNCGEGIYLKVYVGDQKTLKEISQYFIDHNYGKPPTKIQLPSGKEMGEKLIEIVEYVKTPQLPEGTVDADFTEIEESSVS